MTADHDLDTPRLTLRRPRLADFDESAAMWAEPAVSRFFGGQPATREESWARLLRRAGQWALLGYGGWVVRERLSGRFLGEIGFIEAKREITPSLDGMLELGWVLDPAAQGSGYATEAVQAAIDWGAARYPDQPMVCIIAPDNTPSLRVAERCGFTETGRTVYKQQPILVLTRRPGRAEAVSECIITTSVRNRPMSADPKSLRYQTARLPGSSFVDVDLRQTVFDDVNLSATVFRNVTLRDGQIEDADLTNLRITDARLDGMTINGILVTDLLTAYRSGKPA